MGTPTVLADRVLVATTTAGTGTYALGGAVTGYLDPGSAGVPSGSRVPYVVVDSLTSPTRMEVGEGVYTSGSPGTVTRATIRRNTSGGTSAESWPAGTKYLMFAPNAATLATLDSDGRLSAPSLSVSGLLEVGGVISSYSGNVHAFGGSFYSSWQGAPTKGAIYFGTGWQYLHYDSWQFVLSQSLVVNGNVSWTSDARLKEDIRPARIGLVQALRMAPVTFRRMDGRRRARRELGIIAQEAQAAHPLAVSPRQDGALTVSAPAMDAILLGAIRDLAAQVTALRQRVAAMERRRRG